MSNQPDLAVEYRPGRMVMFLLLLGGLASYASGAKALRHVDSVIKDGGLWDQVNPEIGFALTVCVLFTAWAGHLMSVFLTSTRQFTICADAVFMHCPTHRAASARHDRELRVTDVTRIGQLEPKRGKPSARIVIRAGRRKATILKMYCPSHDIYLKLYKEIEQRVRAARSIAR